jgi:hypothetical protein
MLTQEHANQVRSALAHLPYATVQWSDLGGTDKTSILITIAKQKKEDFPHKILQNSQYRMFHLQHDMRLESFSGYGTNKFRAGKVKSVEYAIEKLKTWFETA